MENRIKTLAGQAAPRKNTPPAKLPMSVNFMRLFFRHLGPVFPQTAAKAASRLFFYPKQYKSPEWQKSLLQDRREFRIPFGKSSLQAYHWHATEGKPTALLVHGWENEAAHFQGFIEPLLAKGFGVVMFDAPAHGRSRFQNQTNMFEYGLAIETVIKHFGNIHTLIGHSMGAAASLYRFGKSENLHVQQMVFISCPTDIRAIFTRFREMLYLPEKVLRKMQLSMKQRFNIDDDIYDLSQVCQFVQAERVLIVHDKRDAVVPFGDAERMLNAWPKANFLFTENFGHNRIIRESEPITEIVDFVSETVVSA